MLAEPLAESATAKEHDTGKEESQKAAPKDSVKKRTSSQKSQTQIEDKKARSGGKQADSTGASEILKSKRKSRSKKVDAAWA